MKRIFVKLHQALLTYAAFGWLFVIAAMCLAKWTSGESFWRSLIYDASLAWLACAPVAPLTLVFDRGRRERAMARLCGLREGDERERAITGEAARFTLLLALSVQAVLLAMSLVTYHLAINPDRHGNNEHGLFWFGLSFDADRHLIPFEDYAKRAAPVPPIPAGFPVDPDVVRHDGFLISPSAFSILSGLMLVELAAFKVVASRRYEGLEG